MASFVVSVAAQNKDGELSDVPRPERIQSASRGRTIYFMARRDLYRMRVKIGGRQGPTASP